MRTGLERPRPMSHSDPPAPPAPRTGLMAEALVRNECAPYGCLIRTASFAYRTARPFHSHPTQISAHFDATEPETR